MTLGGLQLLRIIFADDAPNDSGDFIMTSASRSVDKDDALETNITSHLTSAIRTLDEVNERIVTLKPSDGVTAGSMVTSAACDADLAVSRNGQLAHVMLSCCNSCRKLLHVCNMIIIIPRTISWCRRHGAATVMRFLCYCAARYVSWPIVLCLNLAWTTCSVILHFRPTSV